MLRRLSSLVIALVICALVVPSFANKKPPATPVNLNTATSEQLQQVPGIGPSTADKILQFRKSYGAFKSVDDLRAVRGIGPKRLEKMRKYLLVTNAPAKKSPSPAKKPAANSSTDATKKPPPAVTKPAADAEEPEEP